MKKNYVIALSISIVFLCQNVFAQYFANRETWKKEKKEFFIGIGASGFLGDMGGGYNNAIHYSYHDLQVPETKSAFSAGFRYRIKKKLSINGQFSFLQVSGADSLSKNPIRVNRNLNFKSNILELALKAEYVISFSKSKGGKKKSKSEFGRWHSRSSYYYITAGIGAFYFNPKESYQGTWYNIYDYCLEGQGLSGGPPQFKRISFSIPFGIGARYTIAKKYTIGIEYLFRKTFTDYIDGVSTNYYSPDLLLKDKGPIAVALADPNLGKIPGQTNPGQERGNPKDKDSYFTLEVKFGYLLNSKRRHVTKAKF